MIKHLDTFAVVVRMVLLCGACAGDAEPDRGRSARGTATGAIGDSATRPVGRPDPVDAPSSPDTAALGADSTWTAGVVEVTRDLRGLAVLRDVRVASHENFDRIVLDFGEVKAPGYRIEYVDRPVRACGSGEVVPLPGDAWLAIEMRPAAAHDERGYATVRSRDMAMDLPVIERLRSICDFEAVVSWVAAAQSISRDRAGLADAAGR